MNLRAMDTLRSTFGLPVGLSDHTLGLAIPWAAVAMGAEVVEKHLTMDKTLSGPDHAASLEPDEFRALVDGIRDIEEARGDGVKRPMPSEHDTRLVARRSWVALRDMGVGHVVRREDLALKRPGTGIPFRDVHTILGRTTLRRLEADEIITPDALA
jgi:sialic acid synthase SpsE